MADTHFGRAALTLVTATALASACSGSAKPSGEEPAENREAEVYEAVLRAFLADAPPAMDPPRTLYVLDHALERAGMTVPGLHEESVPITSDLQQTLADELRDEAEVGWIGRESSVVARVDQAPTALPCSRVQNGDAVITLAPIDADGDRLEVTMSVLGHEFRDRDCAVYWLHTYVVERTGTTWEVTGLTAPTGQS